MDLPDKLSELMEVGLRDLELVEGDDCYVVNMNYWHRPRYVDDKCEVCLAGAVMAKSFGLDPTREHTPSSGNTRAVSRKLYALNSARSFEFADALRLTNPSMPDHEARLEAHRATSAVSFRCETYEDDPVKFKAYLRAVARELAEAGL